MTYNFQKEVSFVGVLVPGSYVVNNLLKYCCFYLGSIEVNILKIHPILIKYSDYCFTEDKCC